MAGVLIVVLVGALYEKYDARRRQKQLQEAYTQEVEAYLQENSDDHLPTYQQHTLTPMATHASPAGEQPPAYQGSGEKVQEDMPDRGRTSRAGRLRRFLSINSK